MGLFDFDQFSATPAGTDTTNYAPQFSQINANLQQGNNLGNVATQSQLAQQLMARGQTGGVDTSAMQGLAGQLQNQAAGGGPSLAQGQLASATNANASQAASQAASARGLDPAMQARMAGQNQAMGNQQATGQSAALRSGEQMQAQGALAQQQAAIAGVQQQNAAQRLQAQQLAGGVLQGVGSQNLSQQQTSNQLFGNTATAQNQQNANAITNTSNANATNASAAAANAQANANIYGSFINAAGAVVSGATRGHYSGGLIQGDSPKNDVVPAMLSPGEIVLPRSVTQSGNPVQHAAEFVAALQANKRGYADGGTVSDVPWNPNSLASAIALGPVQGLGGAQMNSTLPSAAQASMDYTPAAAITMPALAMSAPNYNPQLVNTNVTPTIVNPNTGPVSGEPNIAYTNPQGGDSEGTPANQKTGDTIPAGTTSGSGLPAGTFAHGGFVQALQKPRVTSYADVLRARQ